MVQFLLLGFWAADVVCPVLHAPQHSSDGLRVVPTSICKQLTKTSGSKRPALIFPVCIAAVLLIKSQLIQEMQL